MVNEGAKILEEGIAQRASDIDVVWVYGYGWPVYRGGPMFWADTDGLGKIVDGLKRQHRIAGISSLLRERRRKAEAPDGSRSQRHRNRCRDRGGEDLERSGPLSDAAIAPIEASDGAINAVVVRDFVRARVAGDGPTRPSPVASAGRCSACR